MARHFLFMGFLCLAVLFALGTAVQAANVVTFQVEVLPGLRLSNPDMLIFVPVAPGQTDIQELNLTVWSNINWELLVKAVGYGVEGGLRGGMEMSNSGAWYELSEESTVIQLGQPPTGPDGATLRIPFRLTGSYEDAPGNYSFRVEFTVVPSL
jgi:hypothetical protein